MVATLAGWNDQAKLANLVTRLKGSAYAFYRTCSAEQRNNFDLLVQELSKRFVPVRIQAIQSSLFHERKQKKGESVDDYAQALRRLYQKAYSRAQHGSEEARAMGKSVLAYQFASGLLPEIKVKVAGTEGDLDVLLTKARFEEAKWKEFHTQNILKIQKGGVTTDAGRQKTTTPRATSGKGSQSLTPSPFKADQVKCRKCGYFGHFQRNCPYVTPKNEEAHGGGKKSTGQLAAVTNQNKSTTSNVSSGVSNRVEQLRQQLMEAEREAAITKVSATILSVATVQNCTVGPTPLSVFQLERWLILVHLVPSCPSHLQWQS